MSILNDKEIRKLCLVPTHIFPLPKTTIFYAQIGDFLYNLEDGQKYEFKENPLLFGNPVTDEDRFRLSHFENRMISPFVPEQVRVEGGQKIISYGTSSMGYDVRLGDKFKIFTNVFNALIDPLDMPEDSYIDYQGDFVIIPPNSYVLGKTIEYFKIPRDITAICVGKSTYARAGCAINVTPIEAGFEGVVVIEIANQTNLPMKVYANMGIAQFLFFRTDPCEVSYADRKGKYQGQTDIQTAIV